MPLTSEGRLLGSQTVRGFYGAGCSDTVKKLERSASKGKPCIFPYVLKDLLNGPSISWKVFKKQEDALSFSKLGKGGLMTFAFEPQDFSSGRLFLSAHPEVFWHYDCQRSLSERCSYEVIPEYAVCKLYADLEFEKLLNPKSNGPEMVNVLINILSLSIKRCWKVRCGREDVLDLDSSTDTKFSRHLVFNLHSACFMNNYHVGAFVKEICEDINLSIAQNQATDSLKGIPISEMRKLMIKDSKGNEKIFCDLSVYSKNRHFRLYRSTKRGKNSPLVVSDDNTYSTSNELSIFLSSLVSFISSSDCKVLEFKNFVRSEGVSSASQLVSRPTAPIPTSPYPAVDKFISRLITPGKIHSSFYFSTSNLIVYNIIGNRFCHNIMRHHKSNNVKYIVDLDKCEYYQKCHDFECSHYRSPPKGLPPEVIFQVTDSSDLSSGREGHLGVFGLPENEAFEVLDFIEAAGSAEFSQFSQENGPELSYTQSTSCEKNLGLPEDEVVEVMDLVEAVSSSAFSEFCQEKESHSQKEPSISKVPSFGLSDDVFSTLNY